MLVMTYSEARQNLSALLDRSKKDGSVLIRRADGSQFKVIPEQSDTSPFEGVKTLANIRQEILFSVLRESREE